ncbi:MAG: GNAT family N-acetyltransferase [Clostridiaceae bacterium]
MLSENQFTLLREHALTFAHSSFTYLDFEAVEHYTVLADGQEGVLLGGEKPEADVYELHWGANDPAFVIGAAQKTGRETLVTFVPEDWKGRFFAGGFAEYGILREYWLKPLDKPFSPRIACEPLTTADAAEAAVVTQSCRLQSREFFGESKERIENWINAVYPEGNENAFGAQHEAVLACRDEEGKIAGVVLTAVYGYGESWGPVAWVREIAVLPKHQNKGYGRALVESALNYGLERGAVKAFLMADDCNAHAISLYRSIGFEPSDEVQIDLVCNKKG